jgi:hypothetical protein
MANASGASFKAPVAKAVPAADPKAADAAVAPAK